ncbi:MAG TPA: hypothetical protein VF490_20830 [Chryseosolibacter sp.]
MNEQIIDSEIETTSRKIYPMKAIWVGTFLGGPLSAGYLIAENFKTLGHRNKVGPTWILAIAATISVFGGVFLIPDAEKLPRQIVPLIYTAIVYAIVQQVQGQEIKAFMSGTGKAFSIWRALGLSLIWCVITLVPVFLSVLLTDPVITAQSKSYGELKHEIYFHENNVAENEADEIAEALRKASFFDDVQRKSVVLDKSDDAYVISIPLIKDAWNDSEVVSYFEDLRTKVQTFFPAKKIIINLSSEEDVTDVKKVLG